STVSPTSRCRTTSTPSCSGCWPGTARTAPPRRTSRVGCGARAATTPPRRTTGRPTATMAAEPGAGRPEVRAGLAELDAAAAAVSGPALAAEFRELLERSPGALYRTGGPRHLTASAVVVDAPAEHVALV